MPSVLVPSPPASRQMSSRASAGRRPPTASPSLAARLVWCLSGLNLAVVVALLLLVFVVSERWWVAAALTYLPRSPWAVPAIVLGLAACWWHRPAIWVNALALGLVVGPLMELRVPGLFNAPSTAVPSTGKSTLRIVSCNVQIYQPDFAAVLNEIAPFRPDVVVLQEALGDHPLLENFFPDWHRLHVETYWIASPYPLRLVAECPSEAFDRVSGILVEVDAPGGPILIADIHQMTARKGLKEINKGSVVTGEAAGLVDGFRDLRTFESAEIRDAIASHAVDRPLIVAGDFNTPTSSNLFQQFWGDLQSAFDVAGVGYGYTSPCKTHRYWLPETPWARIDHILCSNHWTIRECHIGTGNGSDHRLIAAELTR
jgi:endonuclease/exonuclease/phosphatase (EEP) superfamily protein YafD